jgi:putative hemolysin
MCPAKWQTQYDLIDKATSVNTGALLLILEKIENIAELETKPPSMIKPKGAEGKCKMESIDSCIPQKSKQVGFSNKHCSLCTKHGGQHKSHNTNDCRKYDLYGTLIKRNGGTGSAQRNGHFDKNRSNPREREGANYAQMICKEIKKAFLEQSHKRKKCHVNNSESDSNSDYSS